jgi:hypothetical protein
MQTALKNGLAQNKYVVLDMSLVNLTTIADGGSGTPTNTNFNFFGYQNNYLVGIILPQKITKINSYSFANMTGLRTMSIPAAVTTISNNAFWGCTNLTRVTFEGESTLVGGMYSLPNNFKTFYDTQSPKAGTYVWNGTAWSKE